jgi:hypothetical protein
LELNITSETAFCRQLVNVPLPPLKLLLVGSQATSPAAPMTGSPVVGVFVLVGLGSGLAVKVGTEVTVGLTAGGLVAVLVAVGAAGAVAEAVVVTTEVVVAVITVGGTVFVGSTLVVVG